ncbi:MAG TPA: serine/threonine-protein kinase [Ktedonobacteraceae bacterium]|nr:serine/threonine-protein kinase [Ktedonobacteraceae bacterium]
MKTASQHIGHYQLQQHMSQNTTCDVWKAYDTDAQQHVILKLYRSNLPDNATALAHYIHNVERIASLHHTNIVSLYDVQVLASHDSASSPPLICLAMENIEGNTLADYIKSNSTAGKMPVPTEIVALVSSIAQAIDYAHRHGIIHGNLKPSNILLSQSTTVAGKIGKPLLTDFSVTKVTSEKQGNGIPFYLAPEQIKGIPASERSDIYALGVLLYELYTGMLPFRGNRPIAVMMQHVVALPTSPDLVNPAIPPAVTQVIMRCLAKNPYERFSNAASLAVALAQALHTPIPDDLRHSAILTEESPVLATPQSTQSAIPFPGTPDSPAGKALPGQHSSVPPDSAQRTHTSIAKRKRGHSSLVMLSIITLLAISGAIVGALLVLQREIPVVAQGAGHAFFINSSQITENSNSGINDELQIVLSNIPNPVAGKSYYAWLLSDVGQTEVSPIFIGRVLVEHGTIQFRYAGDTHHTNLFGLASRFLITEDSTHSPSSDPLLDQSTWRYYAAIPQKPNPADALHFSQLDHLRHLLVESPELAIRGLHGGLALWFVKDTATVSDLSGSLAGDWQNKDAHALRTQIIRILDYLDGISLVTNDVPPGTPLLANPQIAQVPLLGQSPQYAVPPGYVYQNEPPPGFIYLIQMHLNGAILAPQSTSVQHQIAIHINGGIEAVKRSLTQVYQDARQLVYLTNAQLLQPSTLALLNDMAVHARDAYSGTPSGNALWIYNNLQQLATFDVAPYTATKP